MDTRKINEPIATPTEQEQEAIVGGAAPNTAYPTRPSLEAPESETNHAIKRHWDPHPPVLGPVGR